MDNSTADDFIGSIAVIGMAGRFPGARDVNQFWQNLRDGVESLSFFADRELEAAGVAPALLDHPAYVKAGMILDDIEQFDAALFGFTPREAEITDPQHRLFLECAWEALETAGYDPERYDGAIGVYAGVGLSSYLLNLYTNRELMGSVLGMQAVIGNDKDYLSTRVSYKLNLRGPSMTVQTTCSTSLAAVHLACQGLLNYQSDIALAGGVKLDVPQKAGYLYQEGGILSPDGHCRAFDAGAQGTTGGNGVGIVVLKRLTDAVADGDQIHAVIRGSAINNDGAMKIGYTAPSVRGQAEVIAMAQAVAGVEPATISYVEAHGTGTVLGDPIEIEALTQAFRASTRKKEFCAVGSVKTNIGHLDAAAGVAGLIKTVLALKHRQLPPSLNFTEPNPQIDFSNTPFYVNTGLADWPNGTTARRAGVSSFGIGGTNVHVVLEEAPAVEASGKSRARQLLVLSGKTKGVLERASANLLEHFKREEKINLADAAYTLQVGRRAFSHRRAVVCRDRDDALTMLAGMGSSVRVLNGHWEGGARPVVFMFTGQGAQYLNMGAGIYETEAKFREEVDRCALLLRPQLGLDLREVLYPGAEHSEGAAAKLNETDLTQPALFVLEYALARLWMEWGVRPEAMIGHSIGEYVAACLSGVFTLEEALGLVAVRGRLMQSAERGAMLAVGLPERETEAMIAGTGLSVAAVNSPQQCVVSGSVEAVEEMLTKLYEREVNVTRLPATRAFHSTLMESVASAFAEHLRRITFKPPQIPFISNVTGQWITDREATDAGYWRRQLRERVRFSDGLRELMKEGERVFLEVGPGQTLSRLAKRQAGEQRDAAGERKGEVSIVSSLRQESDRRSDEEQLIKALGQLWASGVEVHWEGFYAHERRQRVQLPTYPFERQRYWIERRAESAEEASREARVSLRKRTDIADWFYVPSWKRSAPPQPEQSKESPDEKLLWLVFIDEQGLGSRLIRRLEKGGQVETVGVMLGQQFAQTAERLYTINPLAREDYDALFAALHAENRKPQRIVHCWGLDPSQPADDSLTRGTREGERVFYSLLYTAQALGKQLIEQSFGEPSRMDDCRIEVLTCGVQEVTGEEEIAPGKAVILGPCKVIPQEYPGVTCRNIDITLPVAETSEEDKLIEQLVAELASEPSDTVTAYRRGRRWAQSFEAVRLEETTAARHARLRQGGVYLITGGLGGLGLETAAYLAASVRGAQLALLARSALPSRDEWPQWLESHDERDATARKIRKLQELEDAGAEVLVLSADVSDESQMRRALERVRRRFGAIHGLIHAAGVPPGGLIQLKTPEMIAGVLSPKVKGTQVLAALLKDEHLDFAVLFSSVRSFLGVPGGVDYSAANAFLDAFAQHGAPFGADTFTVSVNWDGWREVGMGASGDAAQSAEPAVGGEGEIAPAEGVNALGRVLNGSLAQVIVSVQDFPARVAQHKTLTASGYLKELGHTSRPAHPRPDLSSPYVAPATDTERAIAEIWQELLGIEQVGVNDNFFELGGDSILSIQIISKVNRAGLRLTPRQIFEHQTIAELAAVAGTGQAMQAEQGLVTGPLPLTPIQHWFFEKNLPDPQHFNQALLLEVRLALEPSLLEQSVHQLLSHHDALRLRFVESDAGRRQFNAGTEPSSLFSHLDLSGLDEAAQGPAIEEAAAEAQTSLNLSEGPLMRVLLLNLGERRSARLLIVVHHLAIDNVSWRILLEDLQTAYEQLSRGEAVELGAKTTSYKQWAERLAEYAQSAELTEEAAYWLDERRARAGRLPLDYPEGANTEGSVAVVSAALDAYETQSLLLEVPAAYHTQINDVLLTALALGFAAWTGARSLLVDLEGHGRETLFDDVDLSRTVGWFTTIFPVFLELDEETGDPGRCLKAIKEELRAVPHRGMRYGLLRYLTNDSATKERLRALPAAEISFLYWGQMDQSLSTVSLFGAAPESSGNAISPRATRAHLLDIAGKVSGGQLKLDLFYSENVHRRSTVERLAEAFVAALRSLIAHCQSPGAGGYTPSDFSEADLSQDELDGLIAELTASEEQT
jgi:non-ribosomal peptide synthase protein (TIGR01720 family)